MKKSAWIPGIATLLVLGGVTAESLSRPKPADAVPYHARIYEASQRMPKIVGDWEGTDVEVPPSAVKLLNPNALVHRRYSNRKTGQQASLLLVQCTRARDMAGHYPPVCYPAHGWTRGPSNAMEWDIDGTKLPGMEYTYTRIHEGQTVSCVVSNLLILPSGAYVREMSEIYDAAADYLRQFYGAAQLQIVTYGDYTPEERAAIFRELVGANLEVLKVIASGGKQ